MLRAVVWLAVLVLSAAAAWADPATPGGALPVEIAWVQDAITFFQNAGPWGFAGFLLYLLRRQALARDEEVGELEEALKDERAFNRKVQEDRIASAAASADRLATVAVSSSSAITTAAEKNAGVLALCQDIKDVVQGLAYKIGSEA